MTSIRVTKKWISLLLTVALALQGPVFVFGDEKGNTGAVAAEEEAVVTSLDGEGNEILLSLSQNALSGEALDSFEKLSDSKDLVTYVFDGETCPGYEEASSLSRVDRRFSCGDAVLLKAPSLNLNEGVLYYRVDSLLDEDAGSSYVERAHLAISDSAVLAWEEEWLAKGNLEEYIDNALGETAALDSEEVPETEEIRARLYEEVDPEELTATVNGVEDFPASYQTKLQKLASAHPKWLFVRFSTGIDWNDALAAEKGEKSLIYRTAPEEYRGKKHMNAKGEWDGNWYYATSKAIEYYMDPRNSLTETYIFMHESQRFNEAYQTMDMLKSLLAGSFMSGSISSANQKGEDSDAGSIKTYADAFYSYGKGKGVSPIHMAARVLQEQGSGGKSDMISGKYSSYPGYFNFFNIKASGNTDEEKLNAGLAHAKGKGWDTRRKSLKGGAEFLATDYLGRGQDTEYLQKWDFLSPFAHQYMQNIQAPYTETAKVKKSYDDLKITNQAFSFRIPVLKNMPGKAADDFDMKPLTGISLETTELSMYKGEQTKLLVTYEPVATSDTLDVTWESDDSSKVRVDEDGTITAVAAGGAHVTATVVGENGTFRATCFVSVAACTVRYYSSGGTFLSQATAAVGETLENNPCSEAKRTVHPVFPEGEEREGYAFCGWFTQPGGEGLQVFPETVIRENLKIYPYYKIKTPYFTVKQIGAVTYNGKKLCPEVFVYDGERRLTEGKDYKLKYQNNKNASIAGNEARIIVTGKGNYSGSKIVTYEILPLDLKAGGAKSGDVSVDFTGQDYIFAKPQVTWNGKKLKYGKDYTLAYPWKGVAGKEGAYLLQGSYPIEIQGTGNFTGKLVVNEVINRRTSMRSCKIKIEKEEYTGNPITPKITITSKGRTLREGDHYKVICPSDMVSAGSKIIRIQGIPAGGYYGICEKELKVEGVKAGKLSVQGVEDLPFEPSGAPLGYRQKNLVVTSPEGATLDASEYSVSYENSDRVGTAKLIITGKGRYTGTKVVKFKVLPRELGSGVTFDWKGGSDEIPYTKKTTTPEFTIAFDGVVLKEDIDYKVKFKGNKNLTEGSSALPTVSIKGKGNYTGSFEKNFTIVERDFETLNDSLIVTTASYSASGGKWKPSVSIMDTNGNLLKEGKDYTSPEYIYTTNVTVEGKNGSILRKAGDPVDPKDIVPAGTRIKVSVTGCAPYSAKTLTKEFTVQKQLITKLGINKFSKPYTGTSVKLVKGDIRLSDGWDTLTEGVDFEIVESTYRNNIEKGTASVYVRGIGNYSGVRVVKFKITPRILFW